MIPPKFTDLHPRPCTENAHLSVITHEVSPTVMSIEPESPLWSPGEKQKWKIVSIFPLINLACFLSPPFTPYFIQLKINGRVYDSWPSRFTDLHLTRPYWAHEKMSIEPGENTSRRLTWKPTDFLSNIKVLNTWWSEYSLVVHMCTRRHIPTCYHEWRFQVTPLFYTVSSPPGPSWYFDRVFLHKWTTEMRKLQY